MEIIEGRFNQAIVYTQKLDEKAAEQIKLLCNQEFTKQSKIRIMPDVHVGAGCTIGTTMSIKDKIVPNLVGVDIGCGMEVIKIAEKHIEVQKLDKVIKENIPCGFNVRDKEHNFNEQIELEKLYCKNEVNLNRAALSIGTLGGGNHFIESNKDDDGNIYIVVHSGSRHLGSEVAEYYQEEAYKRLNKNSQSDIQNLIEELKAQGMEKEIQKAIKARKQSVETDVPKALAYVCGDLFNAYIHDMKIIQFFAELNRKAMISIIVKAMKLEITEQFTTIHNYIDTDSMILRKGAVSAKANETLFIPMNMRDGSLICVGKGNSEWNYSAPHGAGRLMSRMVARNCLTLSDYKKSMEGIYTSSVNKETLDEAPMAYKPMEEIMSAISDTVEIKKIIKPIFNFKAAERT